MTVHPTPKNLAKDVVRRAWPKRQPRAPRLKNPGRAKTHFLVKARSGGLCERCGRPGESIHHRRKKSAGGEWSASNCVHLCGDGVRGCHGWVEENPIVAHAEGFHVRPWEDPKDRPLLSIHGSVLLTDDGRVLPIGGAA